MDTCLVQPPLPKSPTWREDAKVGTDHWWATDPSMSGKGAVICGEGGLEGGKYGDDVGMPNINPWKRGLWLKDFRLEFPVGEDIVGMENSD